MSTDIYKNYTDNLSETEFQVFKGISREGWFLDLNDEQKIYYAGIYIKTYLDSYYKLPSIPEILNSKLNAKEKNSLISKIQNLDFSDNKFHYQVDLILKEYLKYVYEHTFYQEPEPKRVKLAEIDSPKSSLLKRIAETSYTKEVKEILEKKVDTIHKFDLSDKYYRWMDFVLRIPTKGSDLSKGLSSEDLIVNFYKKINEQAYGLQDVKEEILCSILDLVSEKKISHQCIGLLGPPGVGKTMIITSLSSIVDLPVIEVSLGGVSDASYLQGHDFSYASSEPGIIAKNLALLKTNRCVIYFDELDKVSHTEKAKEIIGALIKITDFTQNHSFRDMWMPEVPIDLSGAIFAFSMNKIEELDPSMLSRMSIIKIAGYNLEEKLKIIDKYMFPSILKNNKVDVKDIILPRDVTNYLFNKLGKSNNHTGLREICLLLNKVVKRIELYRLVEKINPEEQIKNQLTYTIEKFSFPFTITTDLIDQLVSNAKTEFEAQATMFG